MMKKKDICKKCGKQIGEDFMGIEYALEVDRFGIPVWKVHRCGRKIGGQEDDCNE